MFAVVAGAWLLDSAVQNRNPLESLVEIVRDPANARTIREGSAGTGFVVTPNAPSATGAAAGNTVGYSGQYDNGLPAGQANAVVAGALAFARAQIGKPYKWGATGPNSFDCSGLVYSAFKSVGVVLPRTTATLHTAAVAGRQLKLVPRSELVVGDLVFPDAGHVGIYSGNGMFVEAPRAGLKVREVKVWGFLYAARVQPVTAGQVRMNG